MKYEHIETDQQLQQFCDSLDDATTIAFDTEFVSEDNFRPKLCLIQVAVDSRLAVIDPLAIDDMLPFWRRLARPDHETIVHAGREEFRFCWGAIQDRPAGWFDIQLAAGLAGLEYPAAYGNLISRLVGRNVPKGETRTDWRRRPLSKKQLEYALQDVLYLKEIRDKLQSRLESLGRAEWLTEELQTWQAQMVEFENTEQWFRVSGIANLSRRQLAIVREVWRWRNAEADRRDVPARRVLRDDLLVEIARRQTDQVDRIRALRGMEHRHVRSHVETIAERVRAAHALPEDECPESMRRAESNTPAFALLGQFLNTALGCICREAQIATGLVGTVQDVRDLVTYRLDLHQDKEAAPPSLTRGWRAEIVGRQLDQLLVGTHALWVRNPLTEQPLAISPRTPEGPKAGA